MNWEQVKGIVERIITVVVTWMVAKEYIPVGIQAEVVSILILAASIGWGLWVNTQKSLIDSAANMPDVQKIKVDDPAVATAAPSPKVTT